MLILTGSATSDLQDTAPAAVRAAGGHVARFGMPVDPGNLLFHGALGGRPVIGLPGCARSPALNGADWVLERLACGLEVTDDDIAARGVGGLLLPVAWGCACICVWVGACLWVRVWLVVLVVGRCSSCRSVVVVDGGAPRRRRRRRVFRRVARSLAAPPFQAQSIFRY